MADAVRVLTWNDEADVDPGTAFRVAGRQRSRRLRVRHRHRDHHPPLPRSATCAAGPARTNG